MYAVVLFFLAVSATSMTSAQIPVHVDIYYESLCPDSIEFITKQFYPTYKKMAKYMKVTFIPYGHSNTSTDDAGVYSFVCQHGPAECYGNKVQACALSKLQEPAQADFVNCMMSAQNTSAAGLDCATNLNIDYNPIESCVNGAEGNRTLAKLGEMTDKLSPTLKSVPAIAFNSKYDIDEQMAISKNFMSALCNHITTNKPTECTGKSGVSANVASSLVLVLSAVIPAIAVR